MKKILSCLGMSALLLVTVSDLLYAQLYSLETRNARVICLDRPVREIARYVGQSFENSLRFHRRLFNYTPSEPTTILLHDFNDYGSGGTSTIPWNYLTIGIEPFDYVYETCPTNERFNWVMTHELVHQLATDKAAGVDRVFRSIFFGKVSPTADQPLSMAYSYLTSPRWYCPRWYHEGIAAFMETWMSGGIGRALNGYDEMVFRTMVRDSTYIYDYVGLESEGTTVDFQVGANSYLYGTRFVSYLAELYGPEKLITWFDRSDSSSRSFSAQFENVYGTSLPDEWSRWKVWERTWQQANLDSLRRYPLTPFREIVAEPLGSVSRAFYDRMTGKIYVAMNRPGQYAKLVALDLKTGAITPLCNVLSPALYYVCSTAYNPPDGSLFFTTHNSTLWRDINVVNVRTGKTRMLLKNSRIGDLAFNQADSSLWGVQHNDGYSTLVRIPHPYTGWQDIFTLKYGTDIYDPDISPDGKYMVAGMAQISGRQQLIRMKMEDLLKHESAYEVLREFEKWMPLNFVFAPDGRYLFGTTYLTGVSNVVRYDTETKEEKWISNTETGFFRPAPLSPDSLVVFRYTGKGFLPVVIANREYEDVSAVRLLGDDIVERHPVLKGWTIDPPSVINIDSLTVAKGDYNGISRMNLASLYPTVEGYKVYTAVGVRFNIQDYLSLYTLGLNASYTPAETLPVEERFHGSAEFGIWEWKFHAGYNTADFYDLFGPTKTSRKGYSAGVRYSDFLIYERPRTLDYSLSVNGYWGLERLPEYQNVETFYSNFVNVSGFLQYSLKLRSLGAVDYEEGVGLSLHGSSSFIRRGGFVRFYGTGDFGLSLPWDHSSLWLRAAAGYSPGERSEPLANFYFGGFGNNWVDHQEIRRYREYYSFPGIELNAAGGGNFAKVLLEWSLPPVRFRSAGLPSLYCTYAWLAFFAGGLVTNMDLSSSERICDVGAQIDFKLVIFSNLSTTFSLGYGLAFRERQKPSDEFMFSLKIL
jgi:hypothetical protein